MNKLKVGIFTEVYHPTMNGVVVSIDTFKKELARLGVESIVVVPMSRGAAQEEGVIRLPSLPVNPDYPLPLPWLSPVYNHIALQGLNLIHTQHPFLMGRLGLKAARRLRLPIVTTYHTLIVEYAKTHGKLVPFGPDLMRWISRAYCNAVDLVITPSPSMKRELVRYGVTTRIEVNQTGIYLDDFRHSKLDVRQEFSIPKDRRVLLYVGRLSDEKNIKMLLTAFRIVRHENPQVHLLFVGSGPQQKEYVSLCRRLNILDNVTFAGFLTKDKTNAIFPAVDLFVFPSLTDTQGIVIMEAMAAGTPIVAVDALGPGDIIEDGKTGLLTSNDPADFALAILQLLGHPTLKRSITSNAKKEAQKYSANATAKRQLALYQSLLR